MPLSRIVLNKQKLTWNKAFSLRKYCGRRASFLGFSDLSGSMTVEACLILPIFLIFMFSLLYVFQIIQIQTQMITDLHQEGNRLSWQAYGDRQEYNNGIIFLEETYQMPPFLLWSDFVSLKISHQYYGHAWIGYNYNRDSTYKDLTEYVFITETGSVYHRRADCTYLELSVYRVDHSEILSIRNKDGGIYYQCEICGDKVGKDCYLTDYGNRYHSSPVCSGIKRTVFRILLEEAFAQGKRACSKCSRNHSSLYQQSYRQTAKIPAKESLCQLL